MRSVRLAGWLTFTVMLMCVGASVASADTGGPTAIGQDSKGVSYVGFASGGSIERIDASGNVLSSFSTGDSNPVIGISVDTSDNVWVAFTDKVQEYTTSGALETSFAAGSSCTPRDPSRYGGLAVSSTQVFYANNCTQSISIYSRTGQFQSVLNLSSWPRGVAYGPAQDGQPDELYVALPDADQVLTFNADNLLQPNPTHTLTVAATGGGGTPAPGGVAVDIYGQLMVSDMADNSIQLYDTNNNYSEYRTLGHPPNPGSTLGSISSAGAIALHAQDGTALANNIFIADYGNQRVQRWDSGGYTYWATSTTSSAPPQQAPVNTGAPSISGTPAVGQTLTCSNGTWANSPTSFGYGWNRDGQYLGGVSGNTYVVQSADAGHQLTCFVQGFNSAGAGGFGTSAPVTVAAGSSAPSNSVAPSITGTAATGSTLTCQPGTWSGSPTYAYAFLRDGSQISTGQTYVVTSADVGHALTCKVTATNSSGSTTATSAAVTPTAPATCPGPVGVSINSAALYTNNQSVTLTIMPPSGATGVIVSNDGGFTTAQTFPLAGNCSYPWTLASTGADRLPKTVYVRFTGSSVNTIQTFSDDIVLDQTPPVTNSATVTQVRSSAASTNGYLLTVQASDALSGVGTLQYASSKRATPHSLGYAKHVRISRPNQVRWVRVVDRAGNPSKWRRVRFVR